MRRKSIVWKWFKVIVLSRTRTRTRMEWYRFGGPSRVCARACKDGFRLVPNRP